MQAAPSLLTEMLERVLALPPDELDQFNAQVTAATADMVWIPQPGPQTEAYFCDADELFYGGEAGGGKTDLLLGLALTAHKNSLILRRTNKEASKLPLRMEAVLGHMDGWNGQKGLWRLPDDINIEIGGCEHENDKQKYKGFAHDAKLYDEISDFTESQFRFINIWNRSTAPGQRCRIVAAGNPPTTSEGYWVIKYWGPWLDPKHPNPAKDGELRWFLSDENGEDKEVAHKGPHLIGGREVYARSRTFIRAKVTDNRYLMKDDQYLRVLDNLPGHLRDAYRDGRFDLALKDKPDQCIPTSWVLAAQDRWTAEPPRNVPQCAIGVDPTGGGSDENVFAVRYDGWYAPLHVVPGSETPDGKGISGHILNLRKDQSTVVIDMGGGYGGRPISELEDNEVEPVVRYKGMETTTNRTKDSLLGFYNVRSEAYWRFREALDPSQQGGSTIMLPSDAKLVADLTAATFSHTSRGIKLESKEDVCHRLQRSTDRGDAVVMAWFAGAKAMDSYSLWQQNGGRHRRSPTYNTGYANRKGR